MSAAEPSAIEEPNRDGGLHRVRVQRALISVSDKSGVVELAQGLAQLGIEIVSTGGTAAALSDGGVAVRSVEALTGAPEILDGRVKTLHPKIYAGLLAVRDDPEHQATLEGEGIEPIDLVCTNLYPFERTVSRPHVPDDEAIENIDIGGPTMIRAAAKNHRDVAVVVRPESYDAVLAELQESRGEISAETRHWLANEAFAYTARYDAAISRWFSTRYEEFPTHVTVSMEKFLDLSYGENPHQKAAFYTEVGARSHVLSRVAKQHGRALSFNNVLDLDSARRLLADLQAPACVIIKHNNPCGVAEGETAGDAYEKALACDPASAFGAVIAINVPIDEALAERLHENFVEVLIAPGYDEAAMDVLRQKEAIRILVDTEQRAPDTALDIKRVRGGALVQEADRGRDERASTEIATSTEPSEDQWRDLIFAWKVCRHVRSNAIVLAKDRATVGIGAGQMSRVDSVRIAVDKANAARGGDAAALLDGCVVASDAFFPFADGPQAAIDAGARAIIQPGGSKRDGEVIEACEAAGVAMVFTRRRHFRH
ncbi:MAG: bifunctional phosphoribosylaminoimidazolecarboxamide formyltransferase/IMP cyclohydrolase [Actinomycetota bacterium]|nr:bifunctional phosphoribosylaminoimidazolecarboxamide formyltransferase/IMP cyclohydrolase [Actinomycetota bacterium]